MIDKEFAPLYRGRALMLTGYMRYLGKIKENEIESTFKNIENGIFLVNCVIINLSHESRSKRTYHYHKEYTV